MDHLRRKQEEKLAAFRKRLEKETQEAYAKQIEKAKTRLQSVAPGVDIHKGSGEMARLLLPWRRKNNFWILSLGALIAMARCLSVDQWKAIEPIFGEPCMTEVVEDLANRCRELPTKWISFYDHLLNSECKKEYIAEAALAHFSSAQDLIQALSKPSSERLLEAFQQGSRSPAESPGCTPGVPALTTETTSETTTPAPNRSDVVQPHSDAPPAPPFPIRHLSSDIPVVRRASDACREPPLLSGFATPATLSLSMTSPPLKRPRTEEFLASRPAFADLPPPTEAPSHCPSCTCLPTVATPAWTSCAAPPPISTIQYSTLSTGQQQAAPSGGKGLGSEQPSKFHAIQPLSDQSQYPSQLSENRSGSGAPGRSTRLPITTLLSSPDPTSLYSPAAHAASTDHLQSHRGNGGGFANNCYAFQTPHVDLSGHTGSLLSGITQLPSTGPSSTPLPEPRRPCPFHSPRDQKQPSVPITQGEILPQQSFNLHQSPFCKVRDCSWAPIWELEIPHILPSGSLTANLTVTGTVEGSWIEAKIPENQNLAHVISHFGVKQLL